MSQQAPVQPVAITGVGVIGAFGRGMDALHTALTEGREGVGRLTLWESALGEFPVGQYRGNLDKDLSDVPGMTPRLLKRLSRSDALALVAAHEAVAQAGADASTAGAYVGQSVCGTLTSEAL